MNTGFIGTGRITRRLVYGLDSAEHAITVTRRSESISRELATTCPGLEVAETAQEVVDRSEVVFVCLAAEVARDLLPELVFTPNQAVISVMAEMPLDALQAAVAPADEVCVTIPMPSVEQGGCPLPVYPRSESLEALYGGRNPVIPVASEAALQPFWAVAGTMASVLVELQTIARWLEDHIDDKVASERYVTSMYAGYLSKLTNDGAGSLEVALADLSAKGGFNETLQRRIHDSGHYEVLRDGLDKLYGRVEE